MKRVENSFCVNLDQMKMVQTFLYEKYIIKVPYNEKNSKGRQEEKGEAPSRVPRVSFKDNVI